MGNFWSDKVPHHEKKKATSESREKQQIWQKRQNDIRSGRINLHPDIKPRGANEPLNITKHNPNESKAARRKRIEESRAKQRSAIQKTLNKQK